LAEIREEKFIPHLSFIKTPNDNFPRNTILFLYMYHDIESIEESNRKNFSTIAVKYQINRFKDSVFHADIVYACRFNTFMESPFNTRSVFLIGLLFRCGNDAMR